MFRLLHSSGKFRGLYFCSSAQWNVPLLSFPGCSLPSFPSLFCWRIPWEDKNKCGAFTHFRSDGYVAAQAFDDSLADGKSQSGALGKVVHLDKTFEYPVHFVRCNAHTRIGDVECYILAFPVIPVTDVPGGVNLKALPIRLEMTWKIRFLSPSITIFSSEGSYISSTPLGQRKICASCISLQSGWRRTGVMVNSTMPDSILISRGFR